MLTNAAVKAARPRAAAYKIADERGLHLFVAPNGRKSFRWRFRVAGREQLLTFGTWPEISLVDARAQCDVARETLAGGADPRSNMYREDANLHARHATFEAIGRRWHAHMLARWTPVHAGDVLGSLERDIFPAIGAMPIRAITAPVVLGALRLVEQRGRLETARRVRQRISAVFAFAMAEDLVDSDPAAIVGRALMPPPPKRNHVALLEIEDARALLAAAELVDAAATIKLASRFLALTAVRLAGVRGATWAEIEDLDGRAPIWRVPAARMKLAAAKKRDAKNDHVVPLSRQALAILIAAGGNGYDTRSPDALIFAGPGGTAPIGEAAIGELYKRAGFGGRHVPHGWRSTFSTVMNEARVFDRLLIDRALAHAPKDKVEAAYNRSEQLAQRRALFQDWADRIEPAADAFQE